jgi:undecaprenol kinase
MFGRATYLAYELLFTAPFLVFLALRYGALLRKNFKAIACTVLLLTCYGAFIWPWGLQAGTWRYNSEKILGIFLFGAHIEDILWWFFTAFLYASFIAISLEHEKSGGFFVIAEIRGFLRSFRFARLGLYRFCEERNLAIMASFAVAAVITAAFSGLLWWSALIVFVACVVLAIEMLNSAIETLFDDIAPGSHPLIKKAKDAAAAASLLVSFGALLVGALFLCAMISGWQ